MTRRKTYEEVKVIVEGLGFEMIGLEYVDSKTPFEIKCEEGHVEPICLNNLQTRKKCPRCSIISRNNAKRVKQSTVKELVEKEGYTLHEIIEGTNCEAKRLVVQCPVGHEKYNVIYQNFLKGRRCPECKYDKNRNNLVDIIEEMEEEGYEYISGEYKSNRSYLLVKCPKGHEYKTTYGLFQANKRCPQCNESKGERITYNFLTQFVDDKYIIRQHRVKINKRLYKYDFMIDNGVNKLLIEYDGIQHFMPVEAYGGEPAFKKQQIADKTKDEYAIKKDIPLLRIPYNLSTDRMYSNILNALKNSHLLD